MEEEDHHMDPSKDEEFEVPEDLELGGEEDEVQEEEGNLVSFFSPALSSLIF